jgi:PPOX class probable F420-dependent enzyme
VSRRDAITMSAGEAQSFLEEEKTVICATNGRDGFPHLMPLWYVLRDGRLWGWTYAKSQKTKNLERDPRATLLVEAGLDYAELRGVMLRCDVEIHRDVDVVVDFAMELVSRYMGGDAEGARESFRKQAPKRVALEFVERDRVTWITGSWAGPTRVRATWRTSRA